MVGSVFTDICHINQSACGHVAKCLDDAIESET